VKTARAERTEMALDLAAGAEAMVRRAEAAVEAALDPTVRDIAETELREALALQDEVLEAVAPALEDRERRIQAQVREAIASLLGEPWASWDANHRRWMPVAVKARLVRMVGRKRYLGRFPW
jgi:hypothetical protein